MTVRADRGPAAAGRWRHGWLGALLGLAVAGPAAAAAPTEPPAATPPDPVALLARMATALSGTEFEGTLVYLHGHHLTTLRIARRMDGAESRESLLALSGPIRAVARNGRGVTCVLPDARPIQVQRGGDILAARAPDPARLAPHYVIEYLGLSRVAGRDADVIGIIPRDNLRYGYRYFIDRATGLPLKTDLMDNSATPVEQVMFTDLTVIAQATPTTSRVTPVPESAPIPAPASAPSGAATDGAPSRWRFSRLPEGFQVIEHGNGGGAEADSGEHFLLSDGLASVSVTIEPANGGGLTGSTQMGAAHAAGQQRDGWQITAVGEVPDVTVQAILAGLRPVP